MARWPVFLALLVAATCACKARTRASADSAAPPASSASQALAPDAPPPVTAKADAPSEEAGSPDAAAAPPKRVRHGEDFKLGSFTYSVKGVTVSDEVGSGTAATRASRRNMFVVVELTMKNEGKATATRLTDDLKIVDAGGREYRPSPDGTRALSTSGGDASPITELRAGIKKNTVAVFELPESSALGTLTLVIPEKGSPGTGSARFTFAAQ